MSLRRFLIGLLLTLAPALVCIALLLGIVWSANAHPQPGPLVCGVDRLWTWPGGPVTYTFSYTGMQPEAGVPAPLDTILVVDRSGSMKDVSSYLPDAVRRATAGLVRPDNANRFALLYFASDFKIIQDWTSDPSQIVQAANSTDAGGGTNGDAAFDGVVKLFDESGTSAGRRRVAIFFTDAEDFSGNRYVATAERLRQAGVDLLFLLTPVNDRQAALILAGREDHLLVMDSAAQLPARLEQAVSSVVQGGQGTITSELRTNPRIFALDMDHVLAPNWSDDGNGGLQSIAALTSGGTLISLPLVARHVGLWKIGEAPGHVTAIDARGRALPPVDCLLFPRVLVAPLWLLLLTLLPALAWAAFALRKNFHQSDVPPPALLPPVIVEPFVRALPLPKPLAHKPDMLVPSAALGLGMRGRAVLDAVGRQLRGDDSSNALSRLAIVTRGDPPDEEAGESPLQVMPRAHAETSAYLPAFLSRKDTSRSWLDPSAYVDASRDRMNVIEAGRDDRVLNRVAFQNWMDKDLGGRLAEFGASLAVRTGGAGQIFIVADFGDPFASSVLFDALNPVRAATAARPIDITLVLLREGDGAGERCEAALLHELQSHVYAAMLDGSGVPGAPLRALFDRVLVVEGHGGGSVREAADAIVSLLRWGVAQRVYALLRNLSVAAPDAFPALQVAAAKAGVDGRRLSEIAMLELVQRWTLASVLGAIEPSEKGGYRLAAARASGHELMGGILANGAQGLSDGTRALFAAASGGDAQALVAALTGSGALRDEFVRRIVTRALDWLVIGIGRGGMGMSDAVVVMKSLEEAAATPEFASRLAAAGASMAECESFAKILPVSVQAFREQLMTQWVPQAIERIARARDKQNRLLADDYAQIEQGLSRKIDRAFVEDLATDLNANIMRGGEESAAWVVLRARLDAERIVVEGRVSIGQESVTSQPEAFLDTLEERAAMALAGIPKYDLAWLLRRKDDNGSRLASGLGLDVAAGARSVLLQPVSADAETEATVGRFVRMVPRLLGSAEPDVVLDSADEQWIRRIAFVRRPLTVNPMPADAADYVSIPEVAAERSRRRLESKFGQRIPDYPPALRSSFANRDGIVSFARHAVAGALTRGLDAYGRRQWYLGDVPLTSGAQSGLADALARYCVASHATSPPADGDRFSPQDLEKALLNFVSADDALTVRVLAAALDGDL